MQTVVTSGVKPDNSTLEKDIVTKRFKIKDGGVQTSKPNANSADAVGIEVSGGKYQIKDGGVQASKINANACDGTTIEVSGGKIQVKSGVYIPASFLIMSAGDYLIHSNPIERLGNSEPPVKRKETKINFSGTLRIKFDLKGAGQDDGRVTYGRIYRNGVAVGTEQSVVPSAGYVTKSEDIAGWNAEDLIQVYVYCKAGALTTNNYVKNLEIYASNPLWAGLLINY
jgi:hypothetical protein